MTQVIDEGRPESPTSTTSLPPSENAERLDDGDAHASRRHNSSISGSLMHKSMPTAVGQVPRGPCTQPSNRTGAQEAIMAIMI